MLLDKRTLLLLLLSFFNCASPRALRQSLNFCTSQTIFSADLKSCVPVLQSQFCRSRDLWMVLDKSTGLGSCKERPCTVQNERTEECRLQARRDKNISKCPKGQEYTYTVYGDTICDCKPYHTKWDDGNCYKAYERGPCRQNEYLQPVVIQDIFSQASIEAECVVNKCKANEVFINVSKLNGKANANPEFECVNLNSETTCDGLEIDYDEATLEPVCPGLIVRAALTVPELACPDGFRRTFTGQCVAARRFLG
ncbi:uncharacterized protein LOC136031956 [Artemia franciscana]